LNPGIEIEGGSCGEFGMSVGEEFSGRGRGGLLLEALIDWGRRAAIVTKFNLRVRTDNERAIHLYESRGFVCEGTILRDFVVEGV
jgi:GNAT superfamily N-acetyltransferase